MWTGDAGGSQPSCDHCDDKCVVRANSSDIAVGAQTKIVQDSLCVTLATLVNLFAGSDDEEANVEDFAAAVRAATATGTRVRLQRACAGLTSRAHSPRGVYV